MPIRYLILIGTFSAIVGSLLLLRQEPSPPAVYFESDIRLLENYADELVHYATVDRPDNRSRDIFISPGAAEQVANNSTARLPDGTIIVIETHPRRGNQIVDNIHVAEKRSNWAANDYQSTERAGDWNYFSFNPETGSISDENVFRCFDCHANNSHIDFIFSRDNLIDYGRTGTVQQAYCNRPARLPCR